MECPKCQHVNRAAARFCEECGEKLPFLCPNCGNEVRPQAKFCDECGARLVGAAPGPAEITAPPRLEDIQDRLHIPEHLRQCMEEAERALEGENRLVTVLFADLSGFTSMSQQMPSEEVVEKVNDCFKMVTDAVHRYEGSVNRFIGDCVLAFFGAPLAHENDAERAILAALEMQEGAHVLELDISIGINTGMMYFGPIGTQEHLEISAYGEDINLAKRLQETAKPGQILIGASTYRLTRTVFEFRAVQPLHLRNIEVPVPAYEALRVREHPQKLRGIEGLRTRMIGRAREFGELKEVADQWLVGQGRMVSIIGEAGIGKSRLVAELKAYVSSMSRQPSAECGSPSSIRNPPSAIPNNNSPIWLEGRCISIGQPISYWPFLDMLRTYFRLSEGDRPEEVARRVTDGVTDLFPQRAEEFLPFLGRILSVRSGDEVDQKLLRLTPEQIRHQTLVRLRDLFETLARKQPLWLILEDLHWGDDLSLDLLSLLMDSLATTPLMVLCVYRPERAHRAWQLGSIAQRKCLDRYTEITLKPLSGRESRQLVDTLLMIDNLPQSAEEMILQKSEGNPFFIEEVIRSLIDRDLVVRDGEHWKVREGMFDVDVPDTIQSVALMRVDRLQAEAKHVLQCASVIGRLFRYRLLECLVQEERNLNPCLSELEARELVYEERTVPEREYAFRHALTQEATYRSILEKRRREFHHQVAVGMERLYRERLEEYYEELAHHYSRSEDVEKGVEYLLKAGEKAKRSYANEAAIAHLTKGLELLERLPETSERAERELDLQIALGTPLIATRGHAAPEVQSTYARARELCEQVGETPQLFQALVGLRRFYFARGDLQMAHGMGEQLLALAQRTQDPTYLSRAQALLVETFYWLGEFVHTRERCEQVIALYDPKWQRSYLFLYGIDMWSCVPIVEACALWHLGYPSQALRMSDEGLARAQMLSHPFNLAFALFFAASLHQLRREVQAVRARAEALIQLATEQGFPLWTALGTFLQGWGLGEGGQENEGIAQMRQGLDALSATGSGMFRTFFLAPLAEAYGRAGQAKEGLAVLAEALAIAHNNGERFHEAELYRLKGTLLFMQSEGEAEIESCFRRAIDVARRQQAKSLELRAVMSLARLWQKQGKKEEARTRLQEIYNWFDEGFDTADLREAKALLEALS